MEQEDSLAAAAVERFCLSLGSIAGDLALAQGASGVVIAGGLGLRIRDHLVRSGFPERFVSKGRFENFMAAIPVKLIRSEEHTSELQSLMRISYAVFCLKKKKQKCYKRTTVTKILR